MIVITVLALLIALSVFSFVKASDIKSSSFWEYSVALSSMMSLSLILILVINHGSANSTISQYNAIKETIEETRENETSSIERATLTQNIIEVNQEIASYRYWNETIFHLFIPDKLAELEYLK